MRNDVCVEEAKILYCTDGGCGGIENSGSSEGDSSSGSYDGDGNNNGGRLMKPQI